MSKDPYRYFRIEARELVDALGSGLSELESGTTGTELVTRLLRLAHTLKGAARVVSLPGIAEEAHALEEVLAPLRSGGALATEGSRRARTSLSKIDAELGKLSAPSPVAQQPSPAAPAPIPATAALDTIRVELEEVDAVLDTVSEVSAAFSALHPAGLQLERAQSVVRALSERVGAEGPLRGLVDELADALARGSRSVGSTVDVLERELEQLRHHSGRLRLVGASVLRGGLEQAASDAAALMGKEVQLHFHAEPIHLDVHLVASLRTCLLHLVRNAIAHGIELPAQRAQAGKPRAGRIDVSVERSGKEVRVICRDDGAGVDLQAVRQVALRNGTLAQVADEDALIELLFRPGVSTFGAANQVAGRGVGLDVVRALMRELQGEATLRTERGRGTTVVLTAPSALATVAAVRAEAGGSFAWVPREAIRQVRRIASTELLRTERGEALVVEGEPIPFVALSALLPGDAGVPSERYTALLLEVGGARAALGVERLSGSTDALVRPLPPLTFASAAFSGATLDAHGDPELVVEPAGVIAASARPSTQVREGTRPPPLPILVVDDSLTTRMLEQSILEASGYQVELASSAEEGLEKARARRFGVFLVDVEMPGMSGFEFVALTRSDPTLRDVPSILVTSRDSPEDRLKGTRAGAAGYVVKGRFDQRQLLAQIRSLLEGGRP